MPPLALVHDAATTAAPRDFGPRPELTWLPVDCLSVDPSYQRTIDTPSSKRLIRKIADAFDWSAFQAILATPNGPEAWFIIDGQHRVEAARVVGLSLVPSVVVHGVDRIRQVQAFVAANRDRIPVPPQAIFYAQLAAGDRAAATVKRLCDDAGIELLRYTVGASTIGIGKTTAAPALLRVLARHGEERTAQAIAAIASRFRKSQGGLRAPFFEAAAEYLGAGGDVGALTEALWKLLPDDLYAAAQQATAGTRVLAIVERLRKAGGGRLMAEAA